MCDIDRVLRENLNDMQRRAASDPAREVLTLACAGSGKSRTLAYRIAWLMAARHTSAESIVAFTFTEKAAESIKLRVAQALDAAGLDTNALGQMYIGTIHSYCQYILGQMDARYRQFEVLDENRLKLYLNARFGDFDLFPLRNRARGKSYFDTIKQVELAWTMMNEEMIDVQDIVTEDGRLGETLQNLNMHLDQDEYIDFSLMQRLVVDALQQEHEGASRAVSELRHLLVDEYQDINPIQEALIRLLHDHSESLFVVGDDDQAIYGWRGADVTRILTFHERYPGCSDHTLGFNYRSTPLIVRTADNFAAAELGAMRIVKDPSANEPAGPQDYRVLWFPDREQEAEWVASRIAALLGTSYVESNGNVRGLTPGDFAILMRSTRTDEQDGRPRHSAFTDALHRRDIRYTLEAGGGLFDRPQVEGMRQTLALLRGGQPTRDVARSHFENVIQPLFPGASFQAFAEVLGRWGRLIHGPREEVRRRIYPQSLVHELLNAFGIRERSLDDEVMQDLGVFSQIMQDVETVYLSIDSEYRFNSILNFLQNVADAGYDTSTYDVLRRPDFVTVATVHKMKGLEFPVVFVVDMESRRFPKDASEFKGWMPSAVIQDALDRHGYQTTREEETRLFYTAMTRAERYLYVTGCEHLPNGKQRRKPSPFMALLTDDEISNDPAGLPDGLTSHDPVRRIDETVVPTSYSDIRYYLKCPKDYQFRKVYGFSPPITEMFGYGMTVHAAIGKLHERFADRAPSEDESEQVAREVFHLKHVPESGDPENRPGPYERARDSAANILRTYSRDFSQDFERRRQVEERFEVPVELAVISGTIDLLLYEDREGNVLDACVVDFKAMESGQEVEADKQEKLAWTELSLQVQLYAKASREVLRQQVNEGYVHFLKDNQRTEVPIGEAAIDAAVANVEWAVSRIVDGDYPMRPQPEKCAACDFRLLCPQISQQFSLEGEPPPIHVPDGAPQMARAFSQIGQ